MFYQFSQLYPVGKVMELARLAAHALHAIARTAHAGSQNYDPPAFGHVQVNVHANFHRPPTLLATTYKAGNTVMVLAMLAAHASSAITRAARAGSRNYDPPAVGHVQVNVHANFHPPPTLLATTLRQETQKRCSQCSLGTLRARLRRLRAQDPEIKNLKLMTMLN